MRRGLGFGRGILVIPIVMATLVAIPVTVQLAGQQVASASSGTAPLQPATGQFVPITPVKVLDTRDGTGGVPISPVSNGTVLANIPVLGVGTVPQDGVSAVLLNVGDESPTGGEGKIDAYSDDISDPGTPVMGFVNGQNANGTAVVAVGSDGGVSVSVTITGRLSQTDVSASVVGYYTDGTSTSANETYVPLPWAIDMDTRSNIPSGAPSSIAGGGTFTLTVTGVNGVPSSGVDAVDIELGALAGSNTGSLTVYPAGGTSTVPSVVSYTAGDTSRASTVVAVPTTGSNAGQITFKNGGSGSVGLQVLIRGYYLDPSASSVGSVESQLSPEQLPLDSNGDTSIGIAANSTATIQETGVGGIPTSNVAAIMQTVEVSSPSANGWLSIYPAGQSDPSLSVVNFKANDDADVTYDDTMAATTSDTGQITVSNHSSGLISLELNVSGYWQEPVAPDMPSGVSSSFDGTNAVVSLNRTGFDGDLSIMN